MELKNSKTTYLGLMADGRKRYALDCFIGAVQMRESGGEWQDIDPSVEELDADGSTINFTKTPMLVKVGKDSKRRIYPDRTDLSYWIEFQKPFASMGTPTRQNGWFYWDFAHARIGVRVNRTRVKFTLTLKDSLAPSSITIPFTSQGITRQGNLLYHDGKAVAVLTKPFAVDANGVERDVTVTFQSGSITLSLDPIGLTYPIQIDPTVDVSVAASADDCTVYYTGSAWAIQLTTTVQQVGYNTSSASKMGGGMRFLNVNIPVGATIDTSTFSGVASNSLSATTVNSVVIGEKSASPATFSTVGNYQARRGTIVGGADDTQITSASVTWNSIPAWTAETTYTSPEIKTIIQEIVNLAGWLGDGTDDIVIFWDDHAGNTTAVNFTQRNLASWDHATYAPPALHIEYTEAAAGGAQYHQMNGITGINIMSAGK